MHRGAARCSRSAEPVVGCAGLRAWRVAHLAACLSRRGARLIAENILAFGLRLRFRPLLCCWFCSRRFRGGLSRLGRVQSWCGSCDVFSWRWSHLCWRRKRAVCGCRWRRCRMWRLVQGRRRRHRRRDLDQRSRLCSCGRRQGLQRRCGCRRRGRIDRGRLRRWWHRGRCEDWCFGDGRSSGRRWDRYRDWSSCDGHGWCGRCRDRRH